MRVWPLTLRGTGALALGIVSFVLAHEFKITELLYVSALLIVAVAASVATLYLVRRTETVTRAFSPDVAAVGHEVDVLLRVGIRSPLPAAQGAWHDRLADGIGGDAGGVFPAMASGMGTRGSQVELTYRVRAERRGIRSVGPLAITSNDPFGFARRRHLVGGTASLTVAPAIIDLAPLTDLPGEAGGTLHSETNQLGQGADNLIPRHYIPGDSMRRIHWRASAHRDVLMVRQEEQESTPAAVVVFDRSRQRWSHEAFRAPGADPAFEAGVSMCASTVARLVLEGYIVSVLDADGTELVDPIDAGDIAGTEAMAVALATVTAHRDTPLELTVRQFAGASAGPLVFITGHFDTADAAILAPVAHHSSLPVLLAVDASADALERAAEAGWHVASVGSGGDLADAWETAIDRGATRVGT